VRTTEDRAVGRHLRRIREAKYGKRSIARVADLLGYERSTVSRWESGHQRVSVVDAIAFARACGSAPEEIVRGLTGKPVEQLVLGLDAPVGRAVIDLVSVLEQRRRRTA
jgi:transcriptional regulator with XRE-family HTH domain